MLAFARLLYGYKQQFISMIDALDHPEKTFQITAVFVTVNLSLNLVLAWAYG